MLTKPILCPMLLNAIIISFTKFWSMYDSKWNLVGNEYTIFFAMGASGRFAAGLAVLRKVLLHVEARHFVVRVAYLNSWDSGVCCMCRNVAKHNGSSADFRTVADVDVAKQLGMCTEHHAVTDFRVTVADFVAGSAQGHAVQKAHVVADGCGFADDDVGRVVNQKPVADFSGWMDVHAELAADDALEHLGGEVAAFFVKNVGHAVGLQPLEPFEEQQRLKRARASGVAEHGRLDVFCGTKQKVWIFFVDVAEHLFQFRTVNHFACELTS